MSEINTSETYTYAMKINFLPAFVIIANCQFSPLDLIIEKDVTTLENCKSTIEINSVEQSSYAYTILSICQCSFCVFFVLVYFLSVQFLRREAILKK